MSEVKRFLRTKIIDHPLVYIDYWSFLHFFVGVFMYWYNLTWVQAMALMIIYEFIEAIFFAGKFFRPEKMTDSVWDVIIGMAGYLVAATI